jgi:SAM-dependent methyltransferase
VSTTGGPEPADDLDPLARHRRQTVEVLGRGDPAAIKALYRDLGQDFWAHTAVAGTDGVPVLSAPETLDEVMAVLSPATGVLLDAGCGPNPAVAARLAARPDRVVVALDIGWGMVRTAVEVAGASGVRLLGVVGDVENLPFRAGVFDALVCDDTIEHLPDDAAGVAELARVLRPGGRAVLATPNRHRATVLAARARDRRAGRRRPARDYFVAESHLREYTWAEFEALAAPHFRIERRRPVGWRHGRKKRQLTRILTWPGLYRLSQMILLECSPRGDSPEATVNRPGSAGP